MNNKNCGAAFFDIAKNENALDECYDGFSLFIELLKDEDFKHFVSSPVIEINKKEQVLKLAFKDFNVTVFFCVKYLIENNLVFDATEIYDEFKKLYQEEKRIKEIVCYSKQALTDVERTTILSSLSKKNPNYQINLIEKLDDTIGNGYILYAFGKRIDASQNSSIDNLQKSIL